MNNPGRVAVTATQMVVEEFGGKVFGKSVEVLSADHQNKTVTKK